MSPLVRTSKARQLLPGEIGGEVGYVEVVGWRMNGESGKNGNVKLVPWVRFPSSSHMKIGMF